MRALCLLAGLFAGVLSGQQPPADDPFADVAPKPVEEAPKRGFFSDNFGFRKELMSQFVYNPDGTGASRQSVGFEVLKKFSTRTKTVAALNFQGRLVRRDGFLPVSNDMEGQTRPGWFFEYHNAYLDLYNLGGKAGRFNWRAGRFYLPFGLNLQTDTHGPVLQLSNDRNFGYERDWYTGAWGSLNRHLNYDAYYMTGSGYDLKYKGQKGLAGGRVSLANRFLTEYGLEGGVSAIGGERLGMGGMDVIRTRRAGVDARWRRAARAGLATLTTELSRGHDGAQAVSMQLFQGEYLHRSRRWSTALQYRRFAGREVDDAVIGEVGFYFRNDVAGSNLHWVKFVVEQRPKGTAMVLQYYIYR